jgi:DNA-binding transcriptional MerR regulator
MVRKKLTLSVNSEVIKKAKELGLNLSEITENALKITSFGEEKEKLTTTEKLTEAYKKVFRTMIPILKKWNTNVKIGEYYESEEDVHSRHCFEYFLTENEIALWADILDETVKKWQLDDKNIPIEHFYDPERIIKELIEKLYKIAEDNKVKVKKLEVVANLLKLSGLTEEKN